MNLTKYKTDFAILVALEEEIKFLANQFSNLNYTEIEINQFVFKIYDYQNQKILLSPTGIGTTFATSVMTLINAYFHPEYFLICGTAGGIHSELKLCDVVILEKAFEAEMQEIFSMVKNTPFENCIKHPLKNAYFPAHYPADPELLTMSHSLNCNGIKIFKGSGVTSNAFPAPKELFDRIKKFNPYCIDMESSAFYQTAWLLNAKVLSIRGISNILNMDGTDNNVHKSDLQGSSEAAAKVLLAILNNMISCKNQLDSSHELASEAQALIHHYHLQPHLEGGYFHQIYKSNDRVKLDNNHRYDNETRSACTSIFYLLNKTEYSAWHVLKSDEIWYFHKGSGVYIHIIDETGQLSTHVLGDPLTIPGASFQVYIKAGQYFSAENMDRKSYSLVGCLVAPGFEYCDLEIADKNTLLSLYPQHKSMIEKLSNPIIHVQKPGGTIND